MIIDHQNHARTPEGAADPRRILPGALHRPALELPVEGDVFALLFGLRRSCCGDAAGEFVGEP